MITSLTGIVLTAFKREQSTGRSTSGKRDASFATGCTSGTGSAPELRGTGAIGLRAMPTDQLVPSAAATAKLSDPE